MEGCDEASSESIKTPKVLKPILETGSSPSNMYVAAGNKVRTALGGLLPSGLGADTKDKSVALSVDGKEKSVEEREPLGPSIHARAMEALFDKIET